MSDKYIEIVKKNYPRGNKFKNALSVFLWGGIFGVLSEFLLRFYVIIFAISRSEASILVVLTLIITASFLTALGIFDKLVLKFKSALIIPITGFAHSITSAAMEYRKEGLVLGIGSNIFKMSGSVILYGVVSVYIFGIIRLIFLGG